MNYNVLKGAFAYATAAPKGGENIMNDNAVRDDEKHAAAEALSPQVAFEDQEVEAFDIDAAEKALGGQNDDNGPRELA